MPDYSQGKIYKIVNDENDKFYIGSTTQPLYKRMHQHRIMYGCSTSKMEVNMWNCFIILVETIDCKNKDELLRKEREYIEKYREEGLNIVNKNLPGRTRKEYKENNKEKIKEYYQKNKDNILKKTKKYKENNKDKIKKHNKIYKEKNKEITREYHKEHYKINKEKRKENYKNNKQKVLKKVNCECGSIVCIQSLLRHKKTKKHLKHLEELNN